MDNGAQVQKKELSVLLIEEEEEGTECEDSAPPSPTNEIISEVSLNSVQPKNDEALRVNWGLRGICNDRSRRDT